MYHIKVKVVEHLANGTDKVLNEATWASQYGDTKMPSLFVKQSVMELTGERTTVDISSANWRMDSKDGRYSWIATWEPYI